MSTIGKIAGIDIQRFQRAGLLTRTTVARMMGVSWPTYQWVSGDWWTCSASCGGGTQSRSVYCRRVEDLSTVSDVFCNSGTKPASTQTCNTTKCRSTCTHGYDASGFRWPDTATGTWEECYDLCESLGSAWAKWHYNPAYGNYPLCDCPGAMSMTGDPSVCGGMIL